MSLPMKRAFRLCPALVALLAACSGNMDQQGSEHTAQARVLIKKVPAEVGCVQISAQGEQAKLFSFDVKGGDSTELQLSGLPSGKVLFTADAFGTA